MSKKLYIIVVFTALANLCAAQSSKVDSLMQEVNTRPEDSLKVDALVALANATSRQDPKQAIAYAEEALDLSDSLGYQIGILQSQNTLGNTYLQLNLLSRALEFFEKVIEIQKRNGDKTGLAVSYNSIGLIHSEEDLTDAAIEYYALSEKIFEESGNQRDALMPRHNRAVVLANTGQLDEALEIYFSNLEMINELKLSKGWKAATLNNIGNQLFEKGEYSDALKYLQDALEIKNERMDWFGAANTCNNLGKTLVKLGRLEEAERYLDQAEDYAVKTGRHEAFIQNLRERSYLEEAKGNPTAALKLFREFYEQNDSIDAATQVQELETLLAVFKDKDLRRDNELLQAENLVQRSARERRDSYLLAMGAIVLLLLGIVFALFRINRERNRANRLLAEKNHLIEKQRADIMEKNRVFEENNRRLEELNAEKDGLIHVVAHDLKAPLNKTLGLLELMELKGSLNDDQKKFISMVKKVNEDAGRLVRDLLDLNAVESGNDLTEIIEFDVVVVLNEALRCHEGAAGRKRINLVPSIPDETVIMHSRKDYLLRILDNLISNAVKFSESDSQVWIGLKSQGQGLKIWVEDEGPGISKEDQGKMFRKFQKLAARPTAGESSSGLGLAIVKTLVEKLGGQIEVDSALGRGTRFTLNLPMNLGTQGSKAQYSGLMGS